MTALYHVLRIIEILVTMVAAVKLLTCPYEMRWSGKIAKALFSVFWAGAAALSIGNSFYFKYSGLEDIVVCGYTFIVVIIFYQIPVLYALSNSLLFWGILGVIRWGILIIAGNQMGNGSISAYNTDFDRIHLLELLESIIMVGAMLLLVHRKKPLLSLQKRTKRLVIIFLTIAGWCVIKYVVLPYDMLVSREDKRNTMLAMLVLVVMTCGCILCTVYNYWTDEKRNLQLLQLKDSMLEEQIACLEENYQLKRKQIHDSMQQNLLLKGYLAQGKIDEAYQYLETLQNGLKKTQIKGETGITPIDIMLHYKRKQAETEGVRIITDIEVYFCPIEQDDLCIFLGNLLDNAIEAAAELEEEQREIKLRMQTVNRIFLMSVENHYQGKRKMWEGEYITTKQDKGSHGIGLRSSRQIVEKYGGSFQIKDDGDVFRIEAIILNTQRKEEKENEKQSGTETVQGCRESVAGVGGNG